MDSRCLRDLDHLGNRNRRPRAARSGRLYIGFQGDLNPVDTSNPSSNLYVQVSKNIFNKNDNNVGLLRTVKKYGYKKNTANNKIGMGLVISHTYNLSHTYLSHTHTVKRPTSVALLILRATDWLDIDTDSRQDAWSSPTLKQSTCLAIAQLQRS